MNMNKIYEDYRLKIMEEYLKNKFNSENIEREEEEKEERYEDANDEWSQ